MDVFISYARSSAQAAARALHQALGGTSAGVAFLDTEEIEYGNRFPERLADALLGARVVVLFADAVYFKRWYCLFELRAALAPFVVAAAEQAGADDMLQHLVVAIPTEGLSEEACWHLPPALRAMSLPPIDDPKAIAGLVLNRLTKNPPTLAEILARSGGVDQLRRELTETALLPPPQSAPAGTPVVPLLGLRPSLGEDFIGRADDLWRICEAFTSPGGDSPGIVAVEGGAGVGKSRLAVEYVHRFASRRHPGGWFWIDAQQPLLPQWCDILRALDVDEPFDQPQAQLVKALRNLAPDRPAIVVIDNIPEPAAGAKPEPIPYYFPAVAFVPTLMTSRQRLSLAAGGAIRSLKLDVLEAEAAARLLSRNLPYQDVADIDLDEICSWVGRLPLALELLNAALLDGALSAQDLVSRARAGDTTPVLDGAKEALRDVVEEGALRGATEALSISYVSLPQEAQTAAQLLSWMAPVEIPDQILAAFPSNRFSEAVRAQLRARSLVTRSGSAAGFGSMHVVLADFLRTTVVDPELQLVEAVRAVLEIFTPERVQDPTEWPLLRACEPHALALRGRTKAFSSLLHQCAALGHALTAALKEQTRFKEASSIGLETLSWTADENGNIPVGRFHELDRLVWLLPPLLAASGDLEGGITWQRGVVENFPGDSTQMAVAEDNLANMLRQRGTDADLTEAQEIYERTIPFWRDEAPHSLDTATGLNNLALVHLQRGRFADAVPLLEEALSIVAAVKGPGAETIYGKLNLADAIKGTDSNRARDLLESALSDAERSGLPDDHESVRGVLEALGRSAYEQHDYAEAASMFMRALVATVEVYDVEDPVATNLAWALFVSQLEAGNEDEAAATEESYLRWLAAAPDEALDRHQREVRGQLAEFRNRTSNDS